ncbi:YtxH domain-containing protein [Flavobacterium myungsuense]|uniref:YtxH domain-containing protein n=1 Tax=Flavobacterium myungsuense TaxID=651823 RepID=A0ABW3J2L4_9FLAO
MNSSKVLLGVLGGVAAGAIAGILFAPAKGSKTRKRIVNKGKGYANDVKGKFDKVTKDFSNQYETILQEAKDMVSDLQER